MSQFQSDCVPEHAESASAADATPIAAVADILEELNGRGHLAPSSYKLYASVARDFARYCEVGHGLRSLSEVTVDLVLQWLEAPKPNASAPPAMSTRRVRLSALRMLYECGWSMGLLPTDPTRHIRLPGRSGTSARALTDEEIESCRAWAHDPTGQSHRGVVWALAEVGGSPSDIAGVCVEDLDLDGGAVCFRRSTRNYERTLPFSPWGIEEVRRYLSHREGPTTGLLVQFPSTSLETRASDAGMAMIAVLANAGISGTDVKPRSIVAWAARRVFLSCHRIDVVARRFGMRSLDAAAQLVGLDWRSEAD